MLDREIICAACHQPIVGEDESNPHSGHEERCPNYQQWPGLIVPCNCNVRYHAACCPDCNVPNEENAIRPFKLGKLSDYADLPMFTQ